MSKIYMNNIIEDNSKDELPPTPQPEIEISDIYYNCIDCSSFIEILSINEENNIIEFKCLNKEKNHEKKIISIKEYLSKMENYRQKNIGDRCKEHKNKKYVSYCCDCNIHLCEDCLKTRFHINHNKNNIIEIKPIKEELFIIEETIKDYNKKIENLRVEKINKEKEIVNNIKKKKENENKRIKEILKNNNEEKKEELKINKEKYISDIEEIKRKYIQEIKERKDKYEKENNEINSKYKLKEKKENQIYEFKIEEIVKKYNEKIKDLKYDIKIENLINLKKISEIVYNTYNAYNDNYYNCVNINNILLSYYKNENVKNNIMKKILKNNYEDIIKIILRKKDEDIKSNLRKEKIIKENINIKLEEIKEEYNKRIKIILEEKEKEIENYKLKLKEYEKIIREKEEKFNKEIEILQKNISHLLL